MTEQNTPRQTVAPLRNVAALTELVNRVSSRESGLPGMAAFYGPAGFGKTSATTYCAIKLGAIVVQCKSVWSHKDLCEAILVETGESNPRGTSSKMVDRIAECLAVNDLPLLIDEADFLVKKKMIEVTRDIYEASRAPVILIGEELLPQKLQKWERIHSRLLDQVAAQPANLEDVEHLRAIYVPQVELRDDLKVALAKRARGSARRIHVNLLHIADRAFLEGKTSMGLSDFASADIQTGDAPQPRRSFA